MLENLIIVGALKTRAEQLQVLHWIEASRCYAIADVTSGLRFLKHPLLVHTRDFSQLEAKCVWQIGGRLVSKAFNTWLQNRGGQKHVCIDPYQQFEDPNGCITDWLAELPTLDPGSVAGVTIGCHPGLDPRSMDPGSVVRVRGLREQIAQTISKTPWENRILFVGTSLPIRDMDTYAEAGSEIPWVVANRGASGIDGLISTACGFAEGAAKPLILFMGDMSFLYDVSGLSFINKLTVPVIIVVINNHGNGIFSMLPVAQKGDVFKRYFLTPHEHDLSAASKIYGVLHKTVHTLKDFEACYFEALQAERSTVIEVIV